MSRASLFACVITAALAGCGSDLGHPGFGPDGSVPIGDAIGFTNGVSTLAGSSDSGQADGDRNVALFNNPVNVAFGPDGKVYVADFDNSLIRAVDLQGNTTTVVNQKNFVRPFGMAFGPDGTLYVSTDNDMLGQHSPLSGTVWRVNISTGVATVLVNAIGRPRGLAWLPNGQIALVDDLHQVVRLLDPTTGQVTMLAGTWDQIGYADGSGTAARFSTPYGVIVRADGKLVVCDQLNNLLRVVGMDGTVSTLAGSTQGFDDGSMTQAKFYHPQAIVTDAAGNIYVSDDNNYRIRKITADGVSTLALDGKPGYMDSSDLLSAEMFGMEGMVLSSDGHTLFVADGNRGTAQYAFNRIRMVDLPH